MKNYFKRVGSACMGIIEILQGKMGIGPCILFWLLLPILPFAAIPIVIAESLTCVFERFDLIR